ncbi:hypothetical protein Fmac_012067 [Flemingia macrophylla]|uniref:peroxidase n=1 Tax=Flemingia macrophylla TaxID=520843 RepID=A0ABD1MPM8_9FABA
MKCFIFRTRIYNESNIDPSYAIKIGASQVSFVGGDDNLFPLDITTPILFDNAYYKNLLQKKGLLHSDQDLYSGGSTDSIVEFYATNHYTLAAILLTQWSRWGTLIHLPAPTGRSENNAMLELQNFEFTLKISTVVIELLVVMKQVSSATWMLSILTCFYNLHTAVTLQLISACKLLWTLLGDELQVGSLAKHVLLMLALLSGFFIDSLSNYLTCRMLNLMHIGDAFIWLPVDSSTGRVLILFAREVG